ncbi:DUF4113 domain-containing protein [Methylosarcina fibrata]|uniref:DUF4113 domain-containing protein n=1 Tax=Methylosarcina fibrata TaxID=105972 RepID=UPI0012F7A73E
MDVKKTIDLINRRFPKGVSIASTGLAKPGNLKRKEFHSAIPTDWNELVRAKCIP